jgi:mono/diheme cytochrome c family protein
MQATVTVLHTHVLVIVLFLILFAAKALMLFMNKHKRLDKMKRYTKALDIVFGILILVTGGYLVYLYNGIPSWLIIKIVLVLVAIPLGIIGIKRHNKLLTALSLAIFFYVYAIAETKSLRLSTSDPLENTTGDAESTPETDAAETGFTTTESTLTAASAEIIDALDESQITNAKAIYTQACETCHGPDGTKGLGGAADLKVSKLSLQDRINVVENGRGLMPGFGSQLSELEVQSLATYTMTLKK